MDDVATDCGAVFEAAVFLRYFNDLPDPRQRGKVMYPLDEVLLLCLLAVLAGAETFVDIARFGGKICRFCGGSVRFATGRLRTTTSAISSPPSTPSNSSAGIVTLTSNGRHDATSDCAAMIMPRSGRRSPIARS